MKNFEEIKNKVLEEFNALRWSHPSLDSVKVIDWKIKEFISSSLRESLRAYEEAVGVKEEKSKLGFEVSGFNAALQKRVAKIKAFWGEK